jgi:hypothetical protein
MAGGRRERAGEEEPYGQAESVDLRVDFRACGELPKVRPSVPVIATIAGKVPRRQAVIKRLCVGHLVFSRRFAPANRHTTRL